MSGLASKKDRRQGIVYIISNDVNDKVYIGSTTRTLHQRWKSHCRASCLVEGERGSQLFTRAIAELGEQAFHMRELECISFEDLLELEQCEFSYIESYNPSQLYNTVIKLRTMNDETKRKISDTTKGVPKSEITKERMRGHQNCGVGVKNHRFKRGYVYCREDTMQYVFFWRVDGGRKQKSFSYGKIRTKVEAEALTQAFRDTIYPEINESSE
jgi:group I intron endonuclease